MKVLRSIVFGSVGIVILMLIGAIARGDISTGNNYYEPSYTSEMSDEETAAYLEGIVDQYTEDGMQEAPAQPTEPVQEAPAPQPVVEPAYSDTHQTAPMPEELFSASDLIGKWVNEDDPDQVKVVHFFVENNCLMYRYYYIVPGNSIGMNIANEVTEWDCYDGMVSIMSNQGNVYCHRGMDQEISISFYYGFDGPNVMYDQEYGRAFYRAE